jgi:hypothetical protein
MLLPLSSFWGNTPTSPFGQRSLPYFTSKPEESKQKLKKYLENEF